MEATLFDVPETPRKWPSAGGLRAGRWFTRPTAETRPHPPVLFPAPTAQAAKHGSTPDLTAASFGHNLWDLPHLLPGGAYERR